MTSESRRRLTSLGDKKFGNFQGPFRHGAPFGTLELELCVPVLDAEMNARRLLPDHGALVDVQSAATLALAHESPLLLLRHSVDLYILWFVVSVWCWCEDRQVRVDPAGSTSSGKKKEEGGCRHELQLCFKGRGIRINIRTCST